MKLRTLITFGFAFVALAGVGHAEAADDAAMTSAPETTGAESHCVSAGLGNSNEELQSAFASDEVQGAMAWLARGACEKDPQGCGVWKMPRFQPVPKPQPKRERIAREPEKPRRNEVTGSMSAWSYQ